VRLTRVHGTVGAANVCDPYRDIILAKFEQHLSAQRMYQDLVSERGFRHGYDSDPSTNQYSPW
jgi:hypothetical protein